MSAVYRRGSRRKRSRVFVRRGRNGLALSIDGTFASWYAPGAPAGGTVWEALAAPLLLAPPQRRRSVLLLGLAGGSAARVARQLAPQARIVGVERDAEVLRAARRHFDLDALGLEIVCGDARDFLARSRRRFDLVIDDLFVGRGRRVRKPDWLPEPGLGWVARRVASGGLLVSNTLDEAAQAARALRHRYPTLLAIGVEGYDNRVLVATEAPATARGLRRAVAHEPRLAAGLPRFAFRTLAGVSR